MLRFIHISDTHVVHPSSQSDEELNERVRRAVVEINKLREQISFVVHTGDVLKDPHPESAKLATEIFSRLEVPIYFLCGNHDDAATALALNEPHGLHYRTNDSLDFVFHQGEISFVALDAKIGAPYVGELTEAQFEYLEAALGKDESDKVVFVHYPPLSLDCPWGDELLSLQQGERLHELLIRSKGRVRGVFFGHIHRAYSIVRDGILYSSISSAQDQTDLSPGLEKELAKDLYHSHGFQLVAVDKRAISTRQYPLTHGN